MGGIRSLCLLSILLVIASKIFHPLVTIVDFLIISLSLIFFIIIPDSRVKNIKISNKRLSDRFDEMQREPLIDRNPPLSSVSIPKRSLDNEEILSPVRYSKVQLDSTIHTHDITILRNTQRDQFEFSISSSPRQRKTKDLNTTLSKILVEESETKKKFAQDSRTSLSALLQSSCVYEFDPTFLPALESLYEGIFNYHKQLSTLSEQIKEQPKIPGARTRIIIEPAAEEYQKTITEKVKIYNEKLEESKKSINRDIKVELESIVSQVTSDLQDTEHLNNRINAALEILRKLDTNTLTQAVYILCEAVVQRGQTQSDSIDVGPNFAMNFTSFILKIARSYPAIHEIYFLAVIRIKSIFFPVIVPDEIQKTIERTSLKDFNPEGRLDERDKERFTLQMDRARAYAFLLGSLFASKESKFNEGDIWRWLAFVLNLPVEHIDRSHLSILLGFLKTTGGRLRESYGTQFTKLVTFLKGDYLENLVKKFGSNPYLKAYITQLREVIKHLA